MNRLCVFALALLPLLTGCAEMEALRSRNTALEAEINKLRQENTEFQKAYYQISQDRNSDSATFMTRIERLERELAAANESKTEREKELEQYVARMQENVEATRDEATRKLVESDQTVAQLSAAAGDAQQRATQLDAELAALRAERDKTAADLEAARKATADAVAQMDAIKTRVDAMKTENDALKAENAELKKQLESLGAEAKTVAEKSASLEKAMTAADLEKSPELKQWLEEARARIDKHEAAAGVSYRQDKSGARIVIPGDAVFQKGTVTLTDAIKPALDAVAEALKAASDRAVSVVGHTDNQPTIDMPYADNYDLGTQRANAVRQYLSERGAKPARLDVVTPAYMDPLADNKTPEGRAKNRRVEIIVGRKIK